MKNSFLLNTFSEIRKTKRTACLWITLLTAAFLPAITSLILLNRPDVFAPRLLNDPWAGVFSMNWRNGAALIIPVYVIMINSMVMQIEFKNNGWKQLYALPRSFADIFFSKFVVVQLYVLCFFLLFSMFTFFSGYLINIFCTDYHFGAAAFHGERIFSMIGRVYAGILAITSIQFWLSMRFRSFSIPLGIGLGLWIAGLLLLDWGNIIYHPYMSSLLMFSLDSPGHRGTLPLLLCISLGWFLCATVGGFRDIRMRKERG